MRSVSDGPRPIQPDVTVKSPGLTASPLGVLTVIGPLVALRGTVGVMRVPECSVKDARRPTMVTAVAPLNPDPVTATFDPGPPRAGEKKQSDG